MRRVKRVCLPLDLIQRLITVEESQERPFMYHRCIEGLPEEAELVGSYFDPQTFAVVFVFHHPSFPPVQNDQVIPELVPIVSTYYLKESAGGRQE